MIEVDSKLNKRTIIFDFFGVICDEIAVQWFYKNFEKNDYKKLKEEFFSLADVGKIQEKELFSKLSSLVERDTEEVRAEFFNYVHINKELVSFIKTLKKDFKIILASNAVAEFLRKILDENNLYGLFDEIIISSEIGVAKPDADFFEKVIEISNIKKEDILFFIDDSPDNINNAEKIGIKSHLFKSFSELEKFFNRL